MTERADRGTSRWTPLARYVLFMVVIPWFAAMSTQNVTGRRAELSPPELVAARTRAGLGVNQKSIDGVLLPWVKASFFDPSAHKTYVDVSLRARGERSQRFWGGENDPLWNNYRGLLSASANASDTGDVARWALAYCDMRRDSLALALEHLAGIRNQAMPYLAMVRGVAMHGLGDHVRGDSALRAAIGSGKGSEEATAIMSGLLLDRRDWDGLRQLRDDPELRPHIPAYVRRAILLHEGAIVAYAAQVLRGNEMPWMPVLILLAVYCTGVWFFLIRWWDAFEKEPWTTSLAVVAMGALSPMGVYVFHDVASQFTVLEEGRGLISDFWYFTLVVGLVEECVKIIPVFVIGWLQPRQLNERGDWMIYGCLSALGFSLAENYQYLVIHGLQVDTGRFFLSTPLHLSLTGCLALTLRRIRHREPQAWRRFFLVLAGMALIHGVYDFLLSQYSLNSNLVALLLGPLWGLFFLRLLGKVVSGSPYRTKAHAYRVSCTSWFMGAYAVLCLINYFSIMRILGAAEAMPKLAGELIGGQIFLLLGLIYTRFNLAPVDKLLQPTERRAATTTTPAQG